MQGLPNPNQRSPRPVKVRLGTLSRCCIGTVTQAYSLFFISIFGDFMEKSTNRQKYLVLVKLNPSKTLPFFNAISSMQSSPMDGINLSGAYNVFGNWDMAIWFEADSNDDAVHFVGEKIRVIDGVVDTQTMPATTIKEYM